MDRDRTIDLLVRGQELKYEAAERSLAAYVKLAWPILEPKNPLLWNWHLSLICEHLEAVELGQIKRLIINIPPRNLKSNICTVAFPTWVWIKNPAKRFVATSYSASLSTKHSVDRRTLLTSAWYRNAWSMRFALKDGDDTKTEFSNDHRGHMISTSMGGTATGKGGDVLIVDDPHDTTIAASEQKRDTSITTFDQKFTSRLDNKKTGAIIIVMQRLHELDLTGHVLKQGGYVHLCLPAEAEKRERLIFPVSKKEKIREKGEILHPEREGVLELAAAKRAMGSRGYAGQYQQRPTAQEGGIIKRAWIKFYKELPRLNEEIQSWDATFKDTQKSDYVCGTVWGRAGSEKYLIAQVRDRMDIVATIAAITSTSVRYPKTWAKLVEDKANGPAIISLLKTKVPGLIPVTPEGSKEARLSAHAPDFEAGNIYLPHPDIAPWIHDFIEELVNFPNSANDDRVDSTTQALDRLRKSQAGQFAKEHIPDKIKSIASTVGGQRW